MNREIVYSVIGGLLLSGCSTSSRDIAPNYVSPLQYQSYDCDQILAEGQRLNTKVLQLGGRLDEAASNDKSMTVVGAILFWPALFALGGTKNQEIEFARLTGERDALEQVAIQKKCGFGNGGGTAVASASGGTAAASVAQPTAPVQVAATAAAPVASAASTSEPMAASGPRTTALRPPHSMQFPGPYGTMVLTDTLTRQQRSIAVTVESENNRRTVYSTGDVITSNGTVQELRVGELILRVDSGALWTIPVQAGAKGKAAFVTTSGGFKGNMHWEAIPERDSRVRIEATTYWEGGGARGTYVAFYAPDSPVAQSFKTEIFGPVAASYPQGYAPSDRTSAVLTKP
jgi:hypothetical protein